MTKQELHVKYGPKLVCSLPGPKAKAAVEADDRLISPSYTRSYPLVAKRGRGIRVEDVDGNEFLDFAAGIASVSTGHCHPEVVAAIQKQAAELLHISGTDFYCELMTDLADRLSAIAPMPGPHKFFYGNSGAEAIECALKLARYHTGRQNIIAFLGAFHGRTMGALSLTGSKPQQKRRFAPLVPGVTHVRFPYAYRGCSGGAQEEEAFSLGCARYIEEKLFKTVLPPEEVAAIVLEPIQGEGGYVVAPDNFLRELRAICDRHGILLVVDEVQCGMGRTGKWWAIEHSGVEPDMVCMAKGIASGMPLGICMSRAEIMNWVPGSHASTFGGNPVSIAAAMATLDIIEREGMANAARVGALMLQRINSWKQTHASVGDVRGRGLMIGIELVKDNATREPATALRNRVETLAFERGLMVLGCGETTLRICPPLIVSEQEATVALDILEEAIALAEKENQHA
ncbi:MAG: acetyl ornithine aminotransferase family protein [Terracidiphilus sp.]